MKCVECLSLFGIMGKFDPKRVIYDAISIYNGRSLCWKHLKPEISMEPYYHKIEEGYDNLKFKIVINQKPTGFTEIKFECPLCKNLIPNLLVYDEKQIKSIGKLSCEKCGFESIITRVEVDKNPFDSIMKYNADKFKLIYK